MARGVIAAFLGIFLALRIEAAMVSVLVIETGLSGEEEKKQHSRVWENSLLDAFFNEGHIVTNAPIMRIKCVAKGEIPEEAMAEMEAALEGGAGFFFLAQLDYTPGEKTPREIGFAFFKIKPFGKIFERRLAGKSYRTAKEETDNLRSIAQGLIPQLKF
ncbi:MAG: hypothetical protein LBH44_12830 [Treponema sp.]|nr:hypothetical protein [Treponema sp.]